MNDFKQLEIMGISRKVYDLCAEREKRLEERFKGIDEISAANQYKVLYAMQKNRVSAECFNTSTGYGYDDVGRDTLEKVYADVFHTEDALVRPQITCGTHALALALMLLPSTGVSPFIQKKGNQQILYNGFTSSIIVNLV